MSLMHGAPADYDAWAELTGESDLGYAGFQPYLERARHVMTQRVFSESELVPLFQGLAAASRELGIAVNLSGTQVAIAISDTGRGMPAEERRRVFEPFYSRKPAGTGLGLTIARRIVTSHGGRIEIESTPGRGACFTILLPLGGQGDDGDHSHRR